MSFTKLFDHIVSSSVWDLDDKTRIVWVTMLAMKDIKQVVRASICGLAHQARVSVEDCEKAIKILSDPDKHDSSGVMEGRRIEEAAGGWKVINGQMYQETKDAEDRQKWMRQYMREYRKGERRRVNTCKQSLTPVNSGKHTETETETETENLLSTLYASSENKDKGLDTGGVGGEIDSFHLQSEVQTASGNGSLEKKKRPKLPLLMWEDIYALKKNPGYKGIDVEREAYKFKEWCQLKQRPDTLKRFLSWLNRV